VFSADPEISRMNIREHLLQRIEQGSIELPVLPHVAQQAILAINDDRSDTKQLADMITRDQAITAHVLRIANSAAYAPRSPIASLRQAICLLGMRTIRQIVLAVSFKTATFKGDTVADAAREFQHAFVAGLFAQEIARVRKVNVEEAFVSGLLHDVGRSILIQEAQAYRRTHRDEAIRDGDLHGLLSELHAAVGGKMTEAWKLPARVVEAIRYHHEPESAPFHSVNAFLVQLADALAHERENLEQHAALVPLHLYPEEIEKLRSMSEQFKTSAESIA
jgi:putative nucleotidyltransferase with HDIG domain